MSELGARSIIRIRQIEIHDMLVDEEDGPYRSHVDHDSI